MSLFYDKQIPGELWMRDLKDNVAPAYSVLSSVYLKYKDISSCFYSELTSNNILRFDLFYDTFFIETPTGYIFEKFYIENEQIKPYNQLNFLNYKKTTTVDYWFDEKKNKVFYGEIYCFDDMYKDPLDFYFSFILIFKVFDCNTGLTRVLLLDQVKVGYFSQTNWDNTKFFVENPKITYNTDTKTFNVSFIIRNSVYSFGMLSVNILNSDSPYITEVNGFLPYFTIDTLGCSISAVKDLPYFEAFNYILTELGYILSDQVPDLLVYDT